MSTLRPLAIADRVVSETVAELRPGLHKVSSARPSFDESALSSEEKCNIRSKELFEDAIARAGLADHSVRDLALWFGVKRSKLYERMSRRRKDLAPLPEWFARLDSFIEFNRLNAIFARTA